MVFVAVELVIRPRDRFRVGFRSDVSSAEEEGDAEVAEEERDRICNNSKKLRDRRFLLILVCFISNKEEIVSKLGYDGPTASNGVVHNKGYLSKETAHFKGGSGSR